MSFLSGFVAIAGPPNVGKSTLMNGILKTKLSIVSAKPQTTRNRIIGVHHGEGYQIVFVDTPGIHPTKTPLHKSMVESAHSALTEVDIILLMVELELYDSPEVSFVTAILDRIRKPRLLAINKIDRRPRDQLLPIMEYFLQMAIFEEIIPISALTGDGVDRLLTALKQRLRPGPRFFPEDMKTDRSERFLVSEIIREKVFSLTRNELPYSTAVTVDEMNKVPEKKLVTISARIHVETHSQKGILIGRGGKMIRLIGRSARVELEKIFGVHVYLDLFVRVEKNWSKDGKSLKRLGY